MDGQTNKAKTVSVFKLKDLLWKDYIPFLGGRPERENSIMKEEIINLKIDLWSCKTVNDFLKKL